MDRMHARFSSSVEGCESHSHSLMDYTEYSTQRRTRIHTKFLWLHQIDWDERWNAKGDLTSV
jgi:hypothetical protein